MKTIGVVTTARADYGIYLPVLRALQGAPDFTLWLFVTGMHLAPEFGRTVRAIEEDGFEIRERVAMLLAGDSPETVAMSMGLGTLGFAQAFARSRPDLLLILGDRFEMLAATVAALPHNIPIAHLHGGELTEGAIDDAIRHALTKMSHLHFVANETYARRVRQLGEAPERVFVTGGPSLDNLHSMQLLSLAELEARHRLQLRPPFLLVTFHPVTLESGQSAAQVEELLAALETLPYQVLFTYPNADAESRVIIERIKAYAERHPGTQLAVSLGALGYFSVMALASAMVGNSSSGITEAASFRLPVVNIGRRQGGRLAGRNVLHVPPERAAIADGVRRALELDLTGLENLYGDGHASERILAALRQVELGPGLLVKRFCDLPTEN